MDETRLQRVERRVQVAEAAIKLQSQVLTRLEGRHHREAAAEVRRTIRMLESSLGDFPS